MNKKKIFIMVALFLGIWIFLMMIFFEEKVQLDKEEVPQFVVIDSDFFWKYENGRWTDLYKNEEFDLINWKKFNIYINNNYYNTFDYAFNNYTPYFFDDDLNSYEVDNNHLLINEDTYFSLVNYSEVSFDNNDENIVSKFLRKHNKDYSDITYENKYVVNENFSVYVLSNYTDTLTIDDIYYIVFVRVNNRDYMLSEGNWEHSYKLYTILDVGKKYPNLILKYDFMDVGVYAYEMYQFNDRKYEKVIGLEEDE